MAEEEGRTDRASSGGEEGVSTRIVLRPQAERDLDAQAASIGRDSPAAAARLLDAARATFEQLAEAPELGARQEFQHNRLRSVRVWQVRSFESYLVFYQPTQRGIEVIRLLHAARDIEGILADEPQ